MSEAVVLVPGRLGRLHRCWPWSLVYCCPRGDRSLFSESCSSQCHMWWSGVVGVAGTQRRTRANERPQQAAYSSNKNLFCRPNQHKTSTNTTGTQSQTYTVSAGCKESQQTVQSNRSSKTPNSAKFVLSRPSSTIDFATNQLNQIIYQMKA